MPRWIHTPTLHAHKHVAPTWDAGRCNDRSPSVVRVEYYDVHACTHANEQVLVDMTKWGVDYTYDCTGNTAVMRAALESAHRGWGESCVIGVAAAGQV